MCSSDLFSAQPQLGGLGARLQALGGREHGQPKPPHDNGQLVLAYVDPSPRLAYAAQPLNHALAVGAVGEEDANRSIGLLRVGDRLEVPDIALFLENPDDPSGLREPASAIVPRVSLDFAMKRLRATTVAI